MTTYRIAIEHFALQFGGFWDERSHRFVWPLGIDPVGSIHSFTCDPDKVKDLRTLSFLEKILIRLVQTVPSRLPKH